jgi:hypothetical protein
MKRQSLFFANDNMTTEDIKNELIKLDVVYTGGVHAFKITKREKYPPLVTLVTEDDGHFFIAKDAPIFDCSWLEPLSELCKETMDIINKI